MSNRDKYFKGQQADERFICFMRHHWIFLLKEFVYGIIFFIAVCFAIYHMESIQNILRGNREVKLLFATAFLFGTIFMHRFFIKLLNYFVNTGIITEKRFIDHQKTLFFQDSMDSIDLAQIQNIERLGDGILPNIFGYGDLKIFLTASAGVRTFSCLPNVKFHFRCITRQKEIAQKQMLRGHGYIGDEIFNRDIKYPTSSSSNIKIDGPTTPIPFEEKLSK
ncbi:MAG: hypothetical protein O3B47_01260 [bacterium]|nr:hypothetical protein [bacterium]